MGLQIIKPDVNINFIGARRIAFIISAVIILGGLGSLIMKGGPSLGIDFAGGVMVQVKLHESLDLQDMRDGLKDVDLQGVVVQRFGDVADNEYLIRISTPDISSDVVRDKIHTSLASGLGTDKFEIQRLEMVGPKVGADLRAKAMKALFYAVLFIAIYISWRFEQRLWTAGLMAAGLIVAILLLTKLNVPTGYLTIAALGITILLCWYLKLNYALGAVIALIHDVMITVGVFSIFNKEFDLTTVAALLTIIGYSLNDTIIIFDRIKENIRAKISKVFGTTLNSSINQTLSRTLLTSGTTIMVVLCLYFLGGGVIHDFALALLIGVVVGTYSSIFIASPILLAFVPQEDVREGKA